MGSDLGWSDAQLLALAGDPEGSGLFDDATAAALAYADALTGDGIDAATFARVRAWYDEDAIVELTMIAAWENASARFNRALRIPSQQLWRPVAPE